MQYQSFRDPITPSQQSTISFQGAKHFAKHSGRNHQDSCPPLHSLAFKESLHWNDLFQGDHYVSALAIQRPIYLIQFSKISFWLPRKRKRLAIRWYNDLEEQHTPSYLTILSNYIPHCDWPTTAETSRTSSMGCTKQRTKKYAIAAPIRCTQLSQSHIPFLLQAENSRIILANTAAAALPKP